MSSFYDPEEASEYEDYHCVSIIDVFKEGNDE